MFFNVIDIIGRYLFVRILVMVEYLQKIIIAIFWFNRYIFYIDILNQFYVVPTRFTRF